jgi:hypothetical protein
MTTCSVLSFFSGLFILSSLCAKRTWVFSPAPARSSLDVSRDISRQTSPHNSRDSRNGGEQTFAGRTVVNLVPGEGLISDSRSIGSSFHAERSVDGVEFRPSAWGSFRSFSSRLSGADEGVRFVGDHVAESDDFAPFLDGDPSFGQQIEETQEQAALSFMNTSLTNLVVADTASAVVCSS